MKLNDFLLEELAKIAPLVPKRLYLGWGREILTEIKKLRPDFDETKAGCYDVILALCRFEHFLKAFDGYLEVVDCFLAAVPRKREYLNPALKSQVEENERIVSINKEVNRGLLSKKSVGDEELEAALPEESLITLRRVQGLLKRLDDCSEIHRRMQAGVTKVLLMEATVMRNALSQPQCGASPGPQIT